MQNQKFNCPKKVTKIFTNKNSLRKEISDSPPILQTAKARNTTIYIQLIATEGDEYHSATAKTAKEVCKLVDAGFEYVCDVDDLKIFKKRK